MSEQFCSHFSGSTAFVPFTIAEHCGRATLTKVSLRNALKCGGEIEVLVTAPVDLISSDEFTLRLPSPEELCELMQEGNGSSGNDTVVGSQLRLAIKQRIHGSSELFGPGGLIVSNKLVNGEYVDRAIDLANANKFDNTWTSIYLSDAAKQAGLIEEFDQSKLYPSVLHTLEVEDSEGNQIGQRNVYFNETALLVITATDTDAVRYELFCQSLAD